MPDNLQNTSNTDTKPIGQPGLVSDMNSSYITKEKYSYARNAVFNSKDGDLGTIGNEPSNGSCFYAPYDIIGTIPLPDNKIIVFSTDNKNSEIGIGDYSNCTYTKLLNLQCLNFNSEYPIKGVSKRDFQKGDIITFTDKYNPVRRIELKNINKVKTCDDILLFKKIQHPCISLLRSYSGNLPEGYYSVAIAYIVDNSIISDWYSITNRLLINKELGSSIDINISDIDTEFNEFAIALVGHYIDPVTKQPVKVVKKQGPFSTKIKKLQISDLNGDNIQLSELVIKKRTWQKAGIISSNSNYLILGDLVSREEENYQLKAMNIRAEYVVTQVPEDYYLKDGFDVGYYRDENYDFYIQGIYNTGELTDLYHIPGRESSANDWKLVVSEDTYELDKELQQCDDEVKVPFWRAYNTADPIKEENNDFYCGRRILGTGKLGYFESTDLYPDNTEMFGSAANTPIRYHKFPDESKVPRYSIVNGKKYINILGIRFSNISDFDNPDIIGYKIIRSDRKGGNGTVVARGLMSNIRYWEDTINNRTIMYTNYNVNYLGADPFLSSTQTVFKNNKETNYKGLDKFYTDKFSFYSPHTLFEPKYSLGTEIKIEAEEIAEIKGKFSKVYNHPQSKLLNQFAFWLSAAVGVIEASIALLGKKDVSTSRSVDVSVTNPKTTNTSQTNIKIETADDLIKLSIPDLIGMITKASLSADVEGVLATINVILQALQVITALALKPLYSTIQGIARAQEIYDIISNFTPYTDYTLQYNAHANFTKSIPIENGNKRRSLKRPAVYVPSEGITIDDKFYNNRDREQVVYFELNKEIEKPFTKDTSCNTLSGYKNCSSKDKYVSSTGSMYYVTSKVNNPNQYGRLGSSITKVSLHSCPLQGSTTPVLYGGDCIITKMQIMKKMPFFTQNLANTNYPLGVEYDYRLYNNIGYSRYWMDTSKFDFSSLTYSTIVNQAKFTRTTTSKYNLDCKKKNDGKSITRVDDAYMYLSSNCVIDFFVECDYNINFREKGQYPFYSRNNTNLEDIFRSDRLQKQEEFIISPVYTDIYTTEISGSQQREDFSVKDMIPISQPNSVIYSLPSFNLQTVDNWQYFLPANYFAFRESDFGELTGIHKLDQDRIIFLFSKSSPYVSIGRDFLQLEQSGRKITIGDGGLFAQDPREILPTDNNYGACTSRYAFSNTHLGRFYPSAEQGRIFSFAENLDDITRFKVSYWCKNYMPINLYRYFPSYKQPENPIKGVGYLTVFDSSDEILYITKRDYSPKKEFADNITWDDKLKTFKYGELPISLQSNYFNDISWTLSYSPLNKEFIGFHDWHPDWVIQTENHFMTVKGNGVWKHNQRHDSFCNFYGKDYPFEIEFLSTSGQTIEIVRSLEYILEVYKYKNFGRDKYHVMDENFDTLIVSNTEQISPLLSLVKESSNPEENLYFPKKDPTNQIGFISLYSKEENKYRINQFWDTVKDRLEETHLIATDESGYKRVINPKAIDINKPEEQRKKFRHYFNKFSLIKKISGNKKFIVKLLNIKKLVSLR